MTRISSYLTAMLFPLFMATSSLAQTPGAQGPGEMERWGMSAWQWGWGHMMFGGVMMIVFWGGIILLIVLLARWIGKPGIGPSQPCATAPTPLDILKARFARGEIDETEYSERKKVLKE